MSQDEARILVVWVNRLPTWTWILPMNIIHIDTGIFSVCEFQRLFHMLWECLN